MIRYVPLLCSLACVLFASAPLATEGADATDTVAIVFGRKITAAEIGLSSTSDMSQAASKTLLDLIWKGVSDRFARQNNLVATDAECEAHEKYLNNFMKKDRERQKSELAELELKLKSGDLPETKKQELERYRETLLSLQAHDAKMERNPIPKEVMRSGSRQWVTAYKVYKAIYEKYGGTVAITMAGPYPIEARRKLIEEHVNHAEILFVDKTFETKFWDNYQKGGRHLAKKEEIDFTPYWLKPHPEK